MTASTAAAASTLDEWLDSDRLTPQARAFLLVRICQIARVARPDLVPVYWERLQKEESNVQADSREGFNALKASLAPPAPSAARTGFTGEILAEINEASAAAGTDPASARRRLETCEERIAARWWPFGKKPLWGAIARAWGPIDRAKATERLANLPPNAAAALLVAWHHATPLTAGEWDDARTVTATETINAISHLLDEDKPE